MTRITLPCLSSVDSLCRFGLCAWITLGISAQAGLFQDERNEFDRDDPQIFSTGWNRYIGLAEFIFGYCLILFENCKSFSQLRHESNLI